MWATISSGGLNYHRAHGQWTEKFLCDQPTGGPYGSAIISLYPLTQVNHERYKVADGEGRGFTAATIDVPRIGKIRVYVTHLGMGPADTVQEGEVQQLIEFQKADARKNPVHRCAEATPPTANAAFDLATIGGSLRMMASGRLGTTRAAGPSRSPSTALAQAAALRRPREEHPALCMLLHGDHASTRFGYAE